jgi:hypothetical protein
LSKSCQKAGKKLAKSCKKLSKNGQKVVKMLSKSCQKVAKSCQKSFPKVVKKLQKVQNSTNSGGVWGVVCGNSSSKAFVISFTDRPKAKRLVKVKKQ